MLVQYTAMLFFPGGGQAIGASIDVTLDGSNQAPLLFVDALGTIPEVNPLIGDGTGTITFYAAPSLYLAELAGTWTRIPVDALYPDPVFPNLYVHTQAVPAAVWTVNHHFGTRPAVDIIIGGEVFEADVTHPDGETTVITFGSPTTGTANLRR